MPGNWTILNCHRSRLPCHPAVPWVCINAVPPWGCGDVVLPTCPLSKIVIKYLCVGKKKNWKNRNCVNHGLNYAPRTSTKALLTLHYITLCVFPLHSTFFTWFCRRPTAATLDRAPTGRATPRPSHGWLRHGSDWPQPPSSLSRYGPDQPQPTANHAAAPADCILAAAGCALAVARLWQATPWLWSAAPRPWLVEPPQSTHEVR
jgi:hypothetical protein